jgi:hypothetical protein
MEMFYFRGCSAKFCQTPSHIAILPTILPCHLAVWQNSAVKYSLNVFVEQDTSLAAIRLFHPSLPEMGVFDLEEL